MTEDGNTQSGSSRLGSDKELDDPGRDPKGLNPPRNPFGGTPAQDSGQRKPEETPDTDGESTAPEAPTEEDDGS